MGKIGIVMATYNGERYLPEMLDSLVAQKRPADFIVVVDDGSKDSTPEILKSYENRLPLQITILPQNMGHRAAFSKALELARPQLGEDDLIALADQDDIWLPQKFEILENAIETAEPGKNKPDLVFGDAEVVDSDGKTIGNSWRQIGRHYPEPFAQGASHRLYQRHGMHDTLQGEPPPQNPAHPRKDSRP